MLILNQNNYERWCEQGYLLMPKFFSPQEINQVGVWVDEISAWPVKENAHLNYYESIDGRFKLSRTENFLPFHNGLRSLILGSKIMGLMTDIFSEKPFLFKEKINYKFKGTGEYPPHQDIHAFDLSPLAFQEYHVNCAIFVDDSTQENGCFEVVPGYKNQLLQRNADGSIQADIAKKLDWQFIEAKAGDVLIFNCWVPHKSQRNMTDRARRVIYLTYNPESKGDLRQAHLDDRALSKGKTREINAELRVQAQVMQHVLKSEIS